MTFFRRADAGLLQRFREGERSAMESVYRAYVDSVARAIAGALRRYGREGWLKGWREIAADVPDLVQEVFTRAFEPQTRRSFDGVREYGPFLHQIARNVVVDHLRRRTRRMIREAEVLVEETVAGARPSELPADPAMMTIVGDYIERLSPEMRRIHEAMYVRGLSQREAAAALGLGRQVVRTLESRLRQGLRAALETTARPESSSDLGCEHAPDSGLDQPRGSVSR